MLASPPYTFIECCKFGDIEKAQAMYAQNKINIHAQDDIAFFYSCYNGHIDIAKWLYSLNPSHKYLFNNVGAFLHSCSRGHIHVAQWLYSLYHYTGRSLYSAFISGCNKNIDIAKWVYSIEPFYIIMDIENVDIKRWYSRCGCWREGTYFEAFEFL